MYEILTHFIEPLSQAPNFQDFKLPESPEEELPKELEEYIGKVSKFTKAISEFVKNHPELELHNYYEILTAHDIETSAKAFTNLDLKEHDGITIMAILIFIIQMEKFCEGLVLQYVESGFIINCLKRLHEIDNN